MSSGLYGAMLAMTFASAAQAGPVEGQPEQSGSADSQAANTGQIKDIVVTAEKREANLQKVPLSVSTVDGGTLSAAGVTSARGLDTLVTGVKIQGVNSPAVFIRGVGTSNSSSTGDQGVALHLDGVFQSRPTAFAAGFVDVDRVEVLKGPQGTLYGRGALGGNINVISHAPTDRLEGSAAVELGNDRQVTATGVLNVPLTDDLAIRAAVQSDRHDNYAHPIGDDQNSLTGRLRALYKPSSIFTLGITLFHTDRDGAGAASQRARSYTGIPRQSDPWSNALNDGNQYLKASTTEVSAQADVDLGFAKVTYIPAYTWDRYHADTPSLVYLPTPFSLISTTNSNLMTHEVRLASTGSSRLEWTVGGFYMDEKLVYDVNFQPFTHTFGNFKTESASAFAQASYRLLSQLKVIGGLRQNRDIKSQNTNFDTHYHNSWSSTTGRVGLEWTPTAANMIYANLSDGFKAGGFFTAPPPNSFNPERMRSFELGSKNRFLDNHLQWNMAFFWNHYTNYQANVNAPGYGGSTAQGVINAGTARLRGAEVETIATVTRNDRIDAAITFIDSAFTFLLPTSTTAKVGDRLPFSPRWSANAGYQHVFPLGNGATVTARAEAHVESATWLSLNHTDYTRQGGFTKTTANLSYAAPGGRYTVMAYVRNIENRAVKTSVGDTVGFETYILAPPRTYGMSLSTRF